MFPAQPHKIIGHGGQERGDMSMGIHKIPLDIAVVKKG
jgi:hypothetical protein